MNQGYKCPYCGELLAHVEGSGTVKTGECFQCGLVNVFEREQNTPGQQTLMFGE